MGDTDEPDGREQPQSAGDVPAGDDPAATAADHTGDAPAGHAAPEADTPADTRVAAPAETEQVAAAAPRPSPTPTPTPGGPRHAAPEPETRRHPRRWFLGGTAAVLVAGGGGVGAAFLRRTSGPKANPAPAALLAAVATERALLADIDATTGGSAEVRVALRQVRADHAAHLATLAELAAGYDPPKGGSRAPTTAGTSLAGGTPRTLEQLRTAERRAAAAAAGHAATLTDRTATLLASISACEAGHAELLT